MAGIGDCGTLGRWATELPNRVKHRKHNRIALISIERVYRLATMLINEPAPVNPFGMRVGLQSTSSSGEPHVFVTSGALENRCLCRRRKCYRPRCLNIRGSSADI